LIALKIFRMCKKYVLNHRFAFGVFILFSILSSASGLISPYILGDFIDQLINADDIGFIYRYFVLFVLISVTHLIFGYVVGRQDIYLQTRAGYAMSHEYIQKLQLAPLAFTQKRDTAYLSQHIISDTSSLIQFCIGIIQKLVINIVTVGLSLGLMFLFHPGLAGMLLGVCVVYFSIYARCRRILYKVNSELQESSLSMFTKLHEQVSSIRFTKLNVLFSFFKNRFVQAVNRLLGSALQHQRTNYMISSLDILVSITAQMTLLLVGGREIIAGRLTIGRFLIMSSYFQLMLSSIRYFFGLGQMIQGKMVSYNRLQELAAVKPEHNGEQRLDEIYSVRLNSVSFAYDETPILQNINMCFTKGQINVFLGPNGAGKSTLADIIMGLQNGNYTGDVLYNGIDMRNLDMYTIRDRHIGISEQEPILLADTLAYNLNLGQAVFTGTDEANLNRLIKILGLDPCISNLPNHLETMINENAANVSGGEKQKFSILRALLKDPDVLILDEPTSALDVASKTALRAYLDEIKMEKIILVITHDEDFINYEHDVILQL